MANIKSSIKRIDVTKTRTEQNKMVKTRTKNTVKNFDKAVVAKDAKLAAEKHKIAVSQIDKAVTKGVINKNAANRKKAALGKKLNTVK